MALVLGFTVTEFLYTFVGFLVLALALSKWLRERNYPPGPWGIPVLGYSVFLGKKPNEKLRDLSRKYGDMFSFYMGSHLYICVNDFHILKNLITNPVLMFRNPQHFDFMIGRAGIGGMNGEEWQEQRRFAFYTMRNLGIGKSHWERMIKENVEALIEEFRNLNGEPIDVEQPITNSQSSTSMALLFGRHLDEEKDAETLKILRYSTREFMLYFSSTSVNISLGWLRKVMEVFHLGGYDRFFELLHQFENIFIKEVEQRLKTPDSMDKDDFIGCYFREWQKRNKETTNHSFNKTNLIGNLLILFMAGNDSTMASLCWLLLLMAERQDIQRKIHEEIDSVVGRDGPVSYDDRQKFPYTMATIFEMTRWASIAALLPARQAAEDVEINGYVIPQGAHVMGNVWAIMRDPKYFNNPEEFEPERFLTDNGSKASARLDGYVAFSLGKRNCPGEGVAIMTMFLYFVSLMQKFQVRIPPGKKADLEPIFGGAMLPKPQEICFTER